MQKITEQKERGIITHSGMGGFLNPPTHPEHSYHVEFGLTRKKENKGSCSLSSAVENEWLNDDIRNKAKDLLNNWQAPDINSEDVKKWIFEVLGYFNNCYSKDGITRNVNDGLEVIKGNPFKVGIDKHLGVMLIREFYPEYQPTENDFINAKWGN